MARRTPTLEPGATRTSLAPPESSTTGGDAAPAGTPSAGVITGRGLRGFSLGGPLLPLLVLCGIALVQEMDRDAIGVLTPEIRDYFGLDLTTLTLIVSLTGVLTSWSTWLS